jgi:hypothetical protein
VYTTTACVVAMFAVIAEQRLTFCNPHPRPPPTHRPDQVQFLLRLHHLYVRGLQGLRMEQLQLQHSIKAMQQQLAAGARRSTATGSGRASPASAHHGDSSEAAAARDSSSSNTAGPPLSGAVCVHATQAAQRDLQHVPLEDGAGGADLHVWDQRMAVVPQQQQQQQQQQQRGQGVDLGVDVESAGPVAAAAVQGACSTGGQGGPCGRHLALDGWFEGSGASEEACAQLELQVSQRRHNRTSREVARRGSSQGRVAHCV